MTIRWVCLLPDPVTGLDAPILQAGSRQPMIWVAPNREYAVRLIRRDLLPNSFRLCAVVSEIDWTSRQQSQQRAKLIHEPAVMFGGTNPRQTCWRCGAPTPTRNSRYCPIHRQHGRKPKTAKPVAPSASDSLTLDAADD